MPSCTCSQPYSRKFPIAHLSAPSHSESFHAGPRPHLKMKLWNLVLIMSHLNCYNLGTGHTACPTGNRTDGDDKKRTRKHLTDLMMTANVSVELMAPRAKTYLQLPWKSSILPSKVLIEDLELLPPCPQPTCSAPPPRPNTGQDRPGHCRPTGPRSTRETLQAPCC